MALAKRLERHGIPAGLAKHIVTVEKEYIRSGAKIKDASRNALRDTLAELKRQRADIESRVTSAGQDVEE